MDGCSRLPRARLHRRQAPPASLVPPKATTTGATGELLTASGPSLRPFHIRLHTTLRPAPVPAPASPYAMPDAVVVARSRSQSSRARLPAHPLRQELASSLSVANFKKYQEFALSVCISLSSLHCPRQIFFERQGTVSKLKPPGCII
ncbi:hypothetical protein BS78_01G517300 [Paspalum vaginatum]|nr:hypothetical protein BS78_01G517300 [Paspalum vaginatum]